MVLIFLYNDDDGLRLLGKISARAAIGRDYLVGMLNDLRPAKLPPTPGSLHDIDRDRYGFWVSEHHWLAVLCGESNATSTNLEVPTWIADVDATNAVDCFHVFFLVVILHGIYPRSPDSATTPIPRGDERCTLGHPRRFSDVVSLPCAGSLFCNHAGFGDLLFDYVVFDLRAFVRPLPLAKCVILAVLPVDPCPAESRERPG